MVVILLTMLIILTTVITVTTLTITSHSQECLGLGSIVHFLFLRPQHGRLSKSRSAVVDTTKIFFINVRKIGSEDYRDHSIPEKRGSF